MFGIPIEHVIPIANFVGLGFLGLLAVLGARWGQKQPTPAEKAVEVAGALVDATSVRQLAAAIEAQTMEMIAARKAAETESEKARALGYRIVDVLGKIVDELGELRNELRMKRR